MVILEGDLGTLRLVGPLRCLIEEGLSAVIEVENVDSTIALSGGEIVRASEVDESDARRSLVELLATREGRFSARIAEPEDVEGERLEVDLEVLAREAMEMERDRAGTPLSAVPSVTVDPDDDDLQVSGAELRLLMKIDGQRTVEDVTKGGDEAAMEILRGLLERGLVVIEGGADSATSAPVRFDGVACLTLEDADRTTHLLDGDEYVLGRKAENGVAIEHPSVSGTHAKVRRLPEGYLLEDLKSRNGTFVNGVKVDKRLLKDGDRVRLGTVYLVYSVTNTNASGAVEHAAEQKGNS
ncbi:MAG: FHA domain-containing protein [Acidobacteria bacterium]|nr:FHA domain-containing protein [Acidobacteriota bacterium]